MRTPNDLPMAYPSTCRRRRPVPWTLLWLAVVPALIACPRKVALVPKAGPDDVVLYQPDLGEYPKPGYDHIGPIVVTRPSGTARAELLFALRARAARKGADGVILQHIRRGTATVVENDGDGAPVVIAEGLAIFWP